MAPLLRRRFAAWTALLAVVVALPFVALPGAAAALPASVAAADAEAPAAMECDAACPMMEAARRSGQEMPMACHRSASGDAGADPEPGRMGCCQDSGAPPAVPLDEAIPSPLQVVDVPPPAPQPALPAPPVRTAALDASGPPLPAGPPLYTLHSSLLN